MDLKRIVLVMAMVSCFLLSSFASAEADLVSAYTFDETSGTTAADAVRGVAGEAILEGFDGSQWVDGVIGGGVDLDGVNDWMSAVNPIAQGATAMSFSGWVRADSRPPLNRTVRTDRGVLDLPDPLRCGRGRFGSRSDCRFAAASDQHRRVCRDPRRAG